MSGNGLEFGMYPLSSEMWIENQVEFFTDPQKFIHHFSLFSFESLKNMSTNKDKAVQKAVLKSIVALTVINSDGATKKEIVKSISDSKSISDEEIAGPELVRRVSSAISVLKKNGTINNKANNKRYRVGLRAASKKKKSTSKTDKEESEDTEDNSNTTASTEKKTSAKKPPIPVPPPMITASTAIDGIDEKIDIWECCDEHGRIDLLISVAVLHLVICYINELKVYT